MLSPGSSSDGKTTLGGSTFSPHRTPPAPPRNSPAAHTELRVVPPLGAHTHAIHRRAWHARSYRPDSLSVPAEARLRDTHALKEVLRRYDM